MMKNGKTQKAEKALKPSQRKSITDFSSSFGTSSDFKSKARRRKIARIIIFAICIIALVYIGFFITDVLIRISEIPTDTSTTAAHISPEATLSWILFLSIHG